MQVVHQPSGMPFEFPDDTPPETIQQYFRSAEQSMPTTNTSIAQQFIDGARGAYEQHQLAPPPVNGRGFVGLDPQQAQFMLQQRQNAAALQQRAASDQARNRLQQQQLDQQAMEGEKDRSLQIKLFKERFKNEREIAKAQAEIDKFEAEMRDKGKQDDREFRQRLEQMRHDSNMLRDQNKTYNVNGKLVSATGDVIYEDPQAGVGRGSGGGSSAPRVYDQTGRPYTVTPEGEVQYLKGWEPEPGASGGGGGGGEGGGGLSSSDQVRIMSEASKEALSTFNTAKEKADANGQTLNYRDHLMQKVREKRRASGFAAFPTQVEADNYAASVAEKWYPKLVSQAGMTPEKARKVSRALGEVEVARQEGFQARLNADGEAEILDPSTIDEAEFIPTP